MYVKVVLFTYIVLKCLKQISLNIYIIELKINFLCIVQLFLNNISDKKMLRDHGYKYRIKILSKRLKYFTKKINMKYVKNTYNYIIYYTL